MLVLLRVLVLVLDASTLPMVEASRVQINLFSYAQAGAELQAEADFVGGQVVGEKGAADAGMEQRAAFQVVAGAFLPLRPGGSKHKHPAINVQSVIL